MDISLTRTFDLQVIFSVLHNDIIWDAISEDNVDKRSVIPDVLKDYWLRIDSDELAGVFHVHQIAGKVWQAHIHVLPEQRKHSVQIGKEFIRWLDSNLTGNKILAKIPALYPNVLRFAESLGFEEEARITNFFHKNGELHTMHILTRSFL